MRLATVSVFVVVSIVAACSKAWCTLPASPAEPVFTTEFARGDDAPAGWTLSGGQGRWVDRRVLEVTGSGSDSNYWRNDQYAFRPGGLYHFAMRARRPSGRGCVISGPSFANRDQYGVTSDWQWLGHVFRAPENTSGAYLRLGQWEATGSVQFDAVRVAPAIAVHRLVHGMVLGEGESIQDGTYAFVGNYDYPGSNYHRTLDAATAGFNSNRWTFGAGAEVRYRFELPDCRFVSAQFGFNVNHHTGGACTAEVSTDGKQWRAVATKDAVSTATVAVPADLLPARAILVRLRAGDARGSFQVNRLEFQGKLDRAVPDAVGETIFADLESPGSGIELRQMVLQKDDSSGTTSLRVAARHADGKPGPIALTGSIALEGGRSLDLPEYTVRVDSKAVGDLLVPLPMQEPGRHEMRLALRRADSGAEPLRARLAYTVPEFYRADYGERIAGVDGATAVWWCEAGWKVARNRPAPEAEAEAATLAAARGDREAVQIVVRPRESLTKLTAKATPLSGPEGATIPAERIRILRVYYHFVHHPTDATGVRDWWPDALPPFDAPLDVAAGENQPLWILVDVPDGAAAGDYIGQIRLEAEGFSAVVPLKLRVWDFALPKRNHVETAFGFSAGNVFRYHQLQTDDQRRKVLDMYFECFAEHRISPYDPVPLDGIGVKFLPEADPPRAQLDFAAFDREMARVVEKFHFTGYRLPIQGMGGGTFHARHDPKIGEFGENTPEYQAMFSSYVKQLEDHLREKGWLDMAYVYWFDEPAPRDYEFVRNGMERLKKYAPGLRTMLTEEPVDALAGPIDIWCPVSHNYEHEAAEKRRARGERIWWYVCTGPKAPYCTLFIDHPATELRVWLWQTWQRNIVGTLVWQSNYWTSSAAFPDSPQNPYEDPMGYVSGYSTPRGVKRHWGNGDGRFIYPPLAAAAPGIAGPEPVVEPPVSSIRWEMLREGIEDYEYLYLLRERIDQKRDRLAPDEVQAYEALLEVPESITKNMTTFTTDPRPIHARRAQVAEAIEKLGRR